MTKHTPGPWRISLAKPTKTRGIDILSLHARMVGNVWLHPEYMAEAREMDAANAQLIASAPDIASALQALMDFQNGCPLPKYEEGWNAAMKAATAALRKCGLIGEEK